MSCTREDFLKSNGIEGTPEETERKALLLGLSVDGISLSDFAKSIGVTVYDMALVHRRMDRDAGPWESTNVAAAEVSPPPSALPPDAELVETLADGSRLYTLPPKPSRWQRLRAWWSNR